MHVRRNYSFSGCKARLKIKNHFFIPTRQNPQISKPQLNWPERKNKIWNHVAPLFLHRERGIFLTANLWSPSCGCGDLISYVDFYVLSTIWPLSLAPSASNNRRNIHFSVTLEGKNREHCFNAEIQPTHPEWTGWKLHVHGVIVLCRLSRVFCLFGISLRNSTPKNLSCLNHVEWSASLVETFSWFHRFNLSGYNCKSKFFAKTGQLKNCSFADAWMGSTLWSSDKSAWSVFSLCCSSLIWLCSDCLS